MMGNTAIGGFVGSCNWKPANEASEILQRTVPNYSPDTFVDMYNYLTPEVGTPC